VVYVSPLMSLPVVVGSAGAAVAIGRPRPTFPTQTARPGVTPDSVRSHLRVLLAAMVIVKLKPPPPWGCETTALTNREQARTLRFRRPVL
jgi:hypothetical protein